MNDDAAHEDAAELFDRMARELLGAVSSGLEALTWWYDRKGRPITVQEWERLWADGNYRWVGLATVDGIRISTIWLGLDHQIRPSVLPVIFETMTFGPSPFDAMQWRFTSEVAALAWHDQLVSTVRDYRMGRLTRSAVERRLRRGP